MLKKRWVVQVTVLALFCLSTGGRAWAQFADRLTITGAATSPGQQVELDVFIQDLVGTLIDTQGASDGFYNFNIKLFFDSNLVESVQFQRAGITLASSPFVFQDFSDPATGVAQVVCAYFPNRMAINLGAAAPGDLVARLVLTPSAQASGQTISFTFDDTDTNLSGFNGFPALFVSQGTLVLNLGSVNVSGAGGILPVIESLMVSPSTIIEGESATLSWSVSNATSISFNQGIGTVAAIDSRSVSPSTTTTYTLTATNAEGSINQNVTLTVNAGSVPVIQSFEVNPEIIGQGGSATLSWSVTGAQNVQIDQGIGLVSANGSSMVFPTVTTIYTLTAANQFGSVNASATLTVTNQNPPQIQSFTVSPLSINEGQSATLSWSVTDADLVQLTPGFGEVEAIGSRSVSPAGTLIYTLTATNGHGSTQRMITLTVTVSSAPQVISFLANPNEVVVGNPVTVSWEVEGADTVDINGGIGRVPDMGSIEVTPSGASGMNPPLLGENVRYILLATNSTSQAQVNTDVRVYPRLEITGFAVDPAEIVAGGSASLTWSVVNSQTVTLNPGGQSVAASGGLQVQPGETTIYSLIADGPIGQREINSLTLSVLGDPELSVSSETLNFGGEPESQSIELSTNAASSLSWTLNELPIWLDAEPESGMVDNQNPVTVMFSADPSFQFPGQVLNGDLLFTSPTATSALLVIGSERPELPGREFYLYYPMLEAGPEKTSDFTVVNLSEFPVEALIQVFGVDGQLAMDPAEAILPALGNIRVTLEDLPGGTGWAAVTLKGRNGETEGIVGGGNANIRSRDGEELYCLSADRARSDFLYVPHIAKDVSNFFTLSAVVNLSSESRELELETADATKYDVGQQNPGGQAFFEYGTLMGGLIQDPNWGLLSYLPTGASGMVGAEVFGLTPATQKRQAVGVGLSQSASTELYFVHIAQNLENFWTGIVVINLAESAAQIQIEAFSVAGVLIDGGMSLEFAPNEKKTFVVDRRVGLAFGEGAAWLKVTSATPVVGYELFGTIPSDDPEGPLVDQFAGMESISELSNRLAFPHTEDAFTSGGFTGVALINPATTPADLTLRLVSQDGTLKETNQNLSIQPQQKLVELASNLFETVLAFGDIILVESTEKIAGFELYGAGTKMLGALTAWPF